MTVRELMTQLAACNPDWEIEVYTPDGVDISREIKEVNTDDHGVGAVLIVLNDKD